MNKNGILFKMSIINNDFYPILLDRIISILPFDIITMNPATLYKSRKYNKDTFYDLLFISLNKSVTFCSSVSKDVRNSMTIRYDDIANVITLMIRSKECKDESEFLSKISYVLNETKFISASFRDRLDSIFSTTNDISFYEEKGIDTSKLKKVIRATFNDEVLDIEQFSGHSHEYGGIEFTSTYLMWFGKDFFRFVPQETLTSFKECVSNETFDNGTVRIQLYENINDFNTEETDRRQWAFRKHTNIDKVAEEWNKEYLAMASKDKSGANMTIENGNFEHGGVKLVKLYLDKDNNTTTKKHAVKVKCVEYDSAGNVVFDDILSV